ncbi:MAG: hypothetical protein K2H43_01190 [Clostridia bacterium]|nr:hypothetical protein [Clostridia bacterium]
MKGNFFRQKNDCEEAYFPQKGAESVSRKLNRRAGVFRAVWICLLLLGFIFTLFVGFTAFRGERISETRITASAAPADDWKTAIDSATATTPATFKMTAAWSATANSTAGFGTTSGYYLNGALYVPAGKKVILDLNGQTLNRNCSSAIANGYVIYVAGDLVITNSSGSHGYIQGGYSSTSRTAGGVHIAAGGSLTLEAGSGAGVPYIRNNKTSNTYGGAGVYVGGTFNMTGGYITGNSTANTYSAGGVHIAAGGVFTMSGGTIQSNTTGSNNYSVGGVFLYNNASSSFTMTGGRIASNTGYAAGGVFVQGANGHINLGGTAYIRLNTRSSTSTNDDVNFTAVTDVAYIIAPFASGASIGLARTTNGFITKGWETYNSGASVSSYFVASDSSAFDIYEDTDKTVTPNVKEVFYSSRTNATNWDWFVSRSASTGTWQTVKLYSAWTAAASSTGFGVSNGSAGALSVPATAKIILDLNNYTLNRNYSSATGSGYVIYVAGQLIIRDSSSSGGGIIRGGYNSSQNSAGGIVIAGGGICTLEKGRLYYNRATNTNSAGAVYLANNAKFNMTGGKIDGCSATGSTGPGAIFVYGSATSVFTMTGGEISGNTASNANTAGGVYVAANGVVNLGGSARILSNTAASVAKNVYHVTNEAKYKIVEDIEPTFYVGVTKTTNNYTNTDGLTFTSGWYSHSNESPVGKFFADESAVYTVRPGGPSITQREAALWCINNAKNWNEAVAASNAESDASKKQKTVTLYSNWTAATNSSYTTSFQGIASTGYATSSTGFTSGAIYVPASAKILLDMNGYTVNRNLTAARANGHVIQVNGTLDIVDNSTGTTKGTIRGGYTNSAYGSGIHFAAGSLSIHDVNIINNYGSYGAVYMASKLPFTIGGSVRIYNNKETNSSSALARNIYMYDATSIITIDKALTGGQQFTIYRSGRGVFTEGFGRYNAGVDAKTLFKSELSPAYEVENNDTGSYREAEHWCYDNSLNWTYFVGQSITTGQPQTMQLYSNWTAVSNSSYTTAFSTDSYFNNGAIYCPSGANIILDLKGYTINRALSSGTIRNYGYVFRVNGKLTITDSTATASSNKGLITGGWNNYNNTSYGGGAFSVTNGELTLLAGQVINNRGYYGGIMLSGSGKLNLGGYAQIYNNTNTSGVACNINQLNVPTAAVGIVEKLTGKSLSGGQLFGITRLANGTFTSGFETYHPGEEAATYFKSENSNYFVFTDPSSGKKEAGLISYVASNNWEYAVTTSLANSARPETV